MATKQLVAALRGSTGAGLMQCKRALEHSNGDLSAAMAWLASQGHLLALKKATRATTKGVIAVAIDEMNAQGVLAEVNVETDFCARNATLLAFSERLARLALQQAALQPLTPESLLPILMDDTPVSSRLTATIATLGENVTLGRVARVRPVGSGIVAAYIHNALSPCHGPIVTLAALQADVAAMTPAHRHALEAAARRIAMHVTADRENQRPLLDQPFLQGDRTVGEWLEGQRAEVGGGPIHVGEVVTFEVGEGLPDPQTDFSAEVARQIEKAAQ